jgi:hypothetical protein
MKRAVLDEMRRKPATFSDGLSSSSDSLVAKVSDFLQRDGWQVKVHNALFLQLASNDPPNEQLDFLEDVKTAWMKRIVKSINSMCTELSLPLARKRSSQQAASYLTKWETLSTESGNLKSGLKPVFSTDDFYDVIVNIKNPNLSVHQGDAAYWGLIPVEIGVKTACELQQLFEELDPKRHQHLGTDDQISNEFESERVLLGRKVADQGSVATSRQFLKFGCPMGLRGQLWKTALGVEFDPFHVSYFDQLKSSVVEYDMLIDSILMQDVRMTSANDEHFFVFEDVLHQVILALSRDVRLLNHKEQTCLKSYIRGKLGNVDYMVTYPPSGIVPFYGFSLYITPFCYFFESSVKIYLCFSQFYQRHLHRLHNISSHVESIVGLSRQFEDLLQSKEWALFQHLISLGVQPLKLTFNWLMQAFAGPLDSYQTFLLWDRIIGFDSLLLLPVLAVGILMFRKESLMKATSLVEVEAILSDIRFVRVIPLIQLCLFGKSVDL